MEEYYSLQQRDTWDIISDKRYKDIRHVLGPILRTIAISTIKRDKNGNLDWLKYYVCVLNSSDIYQWNFPSAFPRFCPP